MKNKDPIHAAHQFINNIHGQRKDNCGAEGVVELLHDKSIVSIDLNEDKSLLEFSSRNDDLFKVQLNKPIVGLMILELTEIYCEMIGEEPCKPQPKTK